MNDTLALFGFSTTPLELISFVLALINVALNIRQSHWAWLFAIVSSGAYALVFSSARLYGDMGLQLVFIALAIWGWWQWLAGARQFQRARVQRRRRGPDDFHGHIGQQLLYVAPAPVEGGRRHARLGGDERKAQFLARHGFQQALDGLVDRGLDARAASAGTGGTACFGKGWDLRAHGY